MNEVPRDQIDVGNVGAIIDAVSKGYARRKVKMPAKIDRLGLRRDIDRAIAGYHSFVDIGPKEPWQARADHGYLQIAQITDLINMLETGNKAAWWRDQMAARDLDGKPLQLPVVMALKDHRDRLRRLLHDRLNADRSSQAPPGQGPAAELFGKNPESARQWLVGERLANIFEKYFGQPATAGGTAHNVGKNGANHSYGVGSPFIEFVRAVSMEAKIRVFPSSISSFLTRQKKRP